MAKLYFRYGAMGSGKTIDLLKVAYNYEEKDCNVMLFTSGLDDRYGVGKITTRIGISKEAIIYAKDTNLYNVIANNEFILSAILVDEAQFLTRKQVEELSNVVDFLDIPVMCYGLRSDFRQNLFEGSKALMEIADKIEEIKTVCECGCKATVNMRMINGIPTVYGSQVLIGGNDSYKSVCRKCYKKYIRANSK